ncbi:hypothetical protein TWF694_005437 [Orbilia ellipsospora]|uniref:F-box domain-containing protein n=1 Tax=Orbilia ellipsospora TaxID=2528407 RepID=A0AAV9WT35_9PEZI
MDWIRDISRIPPRSILGSLPPEVVLNILDELNTPDIRSFMLVSSWAYRHSQNVIFKRVDLTHANILYFQQHPEYYPLIKEVTWHASLTLAGVGPTNVGTVIALISQFSDLRVIKIDGVRGITTLRAFYRFLRILGPLQSVRRLEVRVGFEQQNGYTRLSSNQDPDWNDLELKPHPNLNTICLEYGPWSMVLTRIDQLTLNLVKPHLGTLERLEVRCIIQKIAGADVPLQLKHHPFRLAPEALAAVGGPAEYHNDIHQTVHETHLKNFASNKLKVFKYYSEYDIRMQPDQDITLEQVCKVWPKLEELDLITEYSWRRELRDFKLQPEMPSLRILRVPGGSQFVTGTQVRADNFHLFHGSLPALEVEEGLVKNAFPNLESLTWYKRVVNPYRLSGSTTQLVCVRVKGFVRYIKRIVGWISGGGNRVQIHTGASMRGTWWGYNTDHFVRL